MRQKEFLECLKKYGQDRFAQSFSDFSDEEKEKILAQADLVDFSMLEEAHINAETKKIQADEISPIETLSISDIAQNASGFAAAGTEALMDGKVGAVCLAGGMGTRLGKDCAKGMVDIGITHEVFIFQRMIESLLETVAFTGVYVPLYIMTSHINDAQTREFFKEHDYFGYDRESIFFFIQDMAPCLDENGDMFLEDRGVMAVSPNGNGGFYSSMIRCGIDKAAKARGVEYLNVFGVDNVMQKIADPVFVGAFLESGCNSAAKVVKKVSPDERVGVICLKNGIPDIVEYYELSEEMRNAVNKDGKLLYGYGVILNYIFRLSEIEKIAQDCRLPVHMVKKKAPFFDGSKKVQPVAPNAIKLETLVLDAVKLSRTCLSYEADRNSEFAPIKNNEGCDSPESARRLLARSGYVL